MDNMNPYLSIIIPTYNEVTRIGKTLDVIISYLKKQSYSSEIIVSDDGSEDETLLITSAKLGEVQSQMIRCPKNRGKGHAVRSGVLKSSGEFILFTDADLSTPIEEVARFIEKINDYEVVIGSRSLEGSNLVERQPFWREWMGKIFNKLARMTTFKGISDSQCGFKLFRRQAALSIFQKQKMEGFSFDVEILYLAQRLGYKVLELPVTWAHSDNTRVNMISDPFKMFLDLFKIWKMHRDLRPENRP